MGEIDSQGLLSGRTSIGCPSCGFSRELPSHAVPPAGTRATCPKCASCFLLPEKIPPLQDAAQPSAEQIKERPVPSFAIKVKFQTFMARDNRFVGKGQLQVKGDFLEITGRRRRLFSFGRKTERYPLTSLRNVTCAGNVVTFAVPLGKGHWQAVVVCSHESTASVLASRLPSVTDSNLFTYRQAKNELQSRMNHLPKGSCAAWSLLICNCLVYLVVAYGGDGWLKFNPDYLITVGGNFSPYTTEGQWWRMFTATFLHAGLVHLIFNMYALYSFGVLAERLYGTRAFLGIYLLAGFAGSCGTLLASPMAVGVGASGAIFGIVGALLSFLITDKDLLSEGARKKLLTNFAIFVVYAIGSGFGKAGIDNAAHVGGLFTGLILGWLTNSQPRFRQEENGWITGRVFAGICLVLVGAGIGIAAAPKPGADFRFKAAIIEMMEEMGAKELALAEELKRISAKGVNATPAEVAQVVRSLKSVYNGDAERLAAMQPESEGLKSSRELLLDYIALKQEGNDLLAEGIEKEDMRSIEAGKQKLSEANEIGSELAKPQTWGS